MMATRLLLLLLFLTGHVFAEKPPDVDCLMVHLKYVHCSWNKQGTPEVNYTFYGWFHDQTAKECTSYMSENGINTGCNQHYDFIDWFQTFYTKLVHGNNSFNTKHDLKNKVKLNPPANLTVQNDSNYNLWFYWNQTLEDCVYSEVRFRTNNKKWDTSTVSTGKQDFCINLISSNSRYELQVRSKIGNLCGESIFWSDWSEPVVWGSNNGTECSPMDNSISVWTPVLYALGALTLILLVLMLLHNERIRIILIPVVPKPSPIFHDVQDWFQLSEGLKKSSKANYDERVCPVHEYCQVSQSDSESSDSSTSSVTTYQTNCSVSVPVNKSDMSTPCSSSTFTVSSEEAEQVPV